MPPDPPLPPVLFAGDVDRSVVAAQLRSGAWIRIRPGAYLAAEHLTGEHRARTVELARIAALGRQLTIGHVVSHESAAVLWSLPVLRPPRRTHIVQAASSRAGCSPDVVRHVMEVPPSDRTHRLGRTVTTLERTVVDCVTACSPQAGLIVADAALHRGADPAACLALLGRMAGRRGVVRARTVLGLADDGAESAGESLTRFALLAAGLPTPTTQVPVSTRLGTFWGDLGWPEWRLLVEYDGRSKYDVGRDALLEEKRREDAIREAGWLVLRVTAADLRDPVGLVQRVRRLLAGRADLHLQPRATLALAV